jgi:hypothetical protein
MVAKRALPIVPGVHQVFQPNSNLGSPILRAKPHKNINRAMIGRTLLESVIV